MQSFKFLPLLFMLCDILQWKSIGTLCVFHTEEKFSAEAMLDGRRVTFVLQQELALEVSNAVICDCNFLTRLFRFT